MNANRLYTTSNMTDYAIPPPPPPEVFLQYTGRLLEKYKLEDKLYHSKTTGSIFENIISYVPGGGAYDALEVWKSKKFNKVRAIDNEIRQEYRKQSGGHGGYTFHSLTLNEIKTLDRCLFS